LSALHLLPLWTPSKLQIGDLVPLVAPAVGRSKDRRRSVSPLRNDNCPYFKLEFKRLDLETPAEP
jgi:hypothetical protein